MGRERSLAAGSALLGLLALFAMCGPFLLADPATISLDEVLSPPSASHWLGTDGLGRDVGSRLAGGGRVSLAVGVVATLVALGVGVPLGAAAGWAGGALDAAVSRLVEALLSLPGLVLALAVLAVAPVGLARLPDALRLGLVLGALGWMPAARFIRAEVLRLKSSEAVAAARSAGAGPGRIVVRHLLPAASAPALVTAAFSVGAAITAESGLSFLGLGVSPPQASWGSMLWEARVGGANAWWLALYPGAALFATVLGCNLIAEGLRRRLSPGRTAP